MFIPAHMQKMYENDIDDIKSFQLKGKFEQLPTVN